jgi:hypothetical protein
MTSKRKKVAVIAGATLCCCAVTFAFFVRYVMQHPDEPTGAAPKWFGPACGVTAIVGMASIAVLITSLAFGLFRKKDKNAGDHFIG